MAIDSKSLLIVFLAVIVAATYFDGRQRAKASNVVERQRALVQEIEPEPKGLDGYLDRRLLELKRMRNAA